MGGKQFKDPNFPQEKIEHLEETIKTFIDTHQEDFKKIFEIKDEEEKNIEYEINDKDEIKENNKTEIDYQNDYVIKKSWKGNNKINPTKCHLSIFNLGALLGKDGFLYSICVFYYHFLQIPNENKTEKEIKTDIDNCLSYIDNGNIDFLNQIWKIKLDEGTFNNLKLTRYTLSNLFKDGINDIIFNRINNKFFLWIAQFCHSSRRNISKFSCILFYFLSRELSDELKENERNKELKYLKKKMK